jgi:AcrR family transcriptional regulator
MPKISDAYRDSRRQEVLDAALACFSENGFHQTGMADIVARSGMSHGAVYGYFRAKDEIIEALADDRHRREALLNAASLNVADPIAGLRALARAYAADLADPGGEARRRVNVHGWAEALRNPNVRRGVIEGIDVPRRWIAGLIEQGQRAGAISQRVNPDAFARSLVALFQGFVLQAAWGEPIDVEVCVAVVDRLLATLSESGG